MRRRLDPRNLLKLCRVSVGKEVFLLPQREGIAPDQALGGRGELGKAGEVQLPVQDRGQDPVAPSEQRHPIRLRRSTPEGIVITNIQILKHDITTC